MLKTFHTILFLIILLIGVIPLLLFSFLFSWETFSLTENAASKELTLRAETIARELDHKVKLISLDLKLLSSDPALTGPAAVTSFQASSPRAVKLLTAMEGFVTANELVTAVFLYDSKGNTIVSFPKVMSSSHPRLHDRTVKPFLQGISAGGKTRYSFIGFTGDSSDAKEPHIGSAPPWRGSSQTAEFVPGLGIHVPLTGDGGNIQGGLMALVPMENLYFHASSLLRENSKIEFLRNNIIISPGADDKGSGSGKDYLASDTITVLNIEWGGSLSLRLGKPRYMLLAVTDNSIKKLAVLLALLLGGLLVASHMIAQKLAAPLALMSDVVRSYSRGEVLGESRRTFFQDFKYFTDTIEALGERIKTRMQDLMSAEEKYRSIFENAVEGIFQCNPLGRFTSVNPSMARIFGYNSPSDLCGEGRDMLNHLSGDHDRMKHFLRSLQTEGSIKTFETGALKKDGTKIWVSINARSVCDREGNVSYIEGTVEDISKRKTAEEQLHNAYTQLEDVVEIRTKEMRDTVAYLNTIIDNLVDGILVVDFYGTITLCNPALKKMFNLAGTELVGKHCSEVLSDDVINLIEKSKRQTEDYFTTGVQLSGGREGSAVVTSVCQSLFSKIMGDMCIGTAVLIRDISKEKEMERN